MERSTGSTSEGISRPITWQKAKACEFGQKSCLRPGLHQINTPDVKALVQSLKLTSFVNENLARPRVKPPSRISRWLAKQPKAKTRNVPGKSRPRTTRKGKKARFKLKDHFSTLSERDKRMFSFQYSVLCPQILSRDSIKKFQGFVRDMGSHIVESIQRLRIVDPNPHLSMSKSQRSLFRSESCMDGDKEIPRRFSSEVIPLCQKQSSAVILTSFSSSANTPSTDTLGGRDDQGGSQAHARPQSTEETCQTSGWREVCGLPPRQSGQDVKFAWAEPTTSSTSNVHSHGLLLHQMYDEVSKEIPLWFAEVMRGGIFLDLEPTVAAESKNNVAPEVTVLAESNTRLFIQSVLGCGQDQFGPHVVVAEQTSTLLRTKNVGRESFTQTSGHTSAASSLASMHSMGEPKKSEGPTSTAEGKKGIGDQLEEDVSGIDECSESCLERVLMGSPVLERVVSFRHNWKPRCEGDNVASTPCKSILKQRLAEIRTIRKAKVQKQESVIFEMRNGVLFEGPKSVVCRTDTKRNRSNVKNYVRGRFRRFLKFHLQRQETVNTPEKSDSVCNIGEQEGQFLQEDNVPSTQEKDKQFPLADFLDYGKRNWSKELLTGLASAIRSNKQNSFQVEGNIGKDERVLNECQNNAVNNLKGLSELKMKKSCLRSGSQLQTAGFCTNNYDSNVISHGSPFSQSANTCRKNSACEINLNHQFSHSQVHHLNQCNSSLGKQDCFYEFSVDGVCSIDRSCFPKYSPAFDDLSSCGKTLPTNSYKVNQHTETQVGLDNPQKESRGGNTKQCAHVACQTVPSRRLEWAFETFHPVETPMTEKATRKNKRNKLPLGRCADQDILAVIEEAVKIRRDLAKFVRSQFGSWTIYDGDPTIQSTSCTTLPQIQDTSTRKNVSFSFSDLGDTQDGQKKYGRSGDLMPCSRISPKTFNISKEKKPATLVTSQEDFLRQYEDFKKPNTLSSNTDENQTFSDTPNNMPDSQTLTCHKHTPINVASEQSNHEQPSYSGCPALYYQPDTDYFSPHRLLNQTWSHLMPDDDRGSTVEKRMSTSSSAKISVPSQLSPSRASTQSRESRNSVTYSESPRMHNAGMTYDDTDRVYQKSNPNVGSQRVSMAPTMFNSPPKGYSRHSIDLNGIDVSSRGGSPRRPETGLSVTSNSTSKTLPEDTQGSSSQHTVSPRRNSSIPREHTNGSPSFNTRNEFKARTGGSQGIEIQTEHLQSVDAGIMFPSRHSLSSQTSGGSRLSREIKGSERTFQTPGRESFEARPYHSFEGGYWGMGQQRGFSALEVEFEKALKDYREALDAASIGLFFEKSKQQSISSEPKDDARTRSFHAWDDECPCKKTKQLVDTSAGPSIPHSPGNRTVNPQMPQSDGRHSVKGIDGTDAGADLGKRQEASSGYQYVTGYRPQIRNMASSPVRTPVANSSRSWKSSYQEYQPSSPTAPVKPQSCLKSESKRLSSSQLDALAFINYLCTSGKVDSRKVAEYSMKCADTAKPKCVVNFSCEEKEANNKDLNPCEYIAKMASLLKVNEGRQNGSYSMGGNRQADIGCSVQHSQQNKPLCSQDSAMRMINNPFLNDTRKAFPKNRQLLTDIHKITSKGREEQIDSRYPYTRRERWDKSDTIQPSFGRTGCPCVEMKSQQRIPTFYAEQKNNYTNRPPCSSPARGLNETYVPRLKTQCLAPDVDGGEIMDIRKCGKNVESTSVQTCECLLDMALRSNAGGTNHYATTCLGCEEWSHKPHHSHSMDSSAFTKGIQCHITERIQETRAPTKRKAPIRARSRKNKKLQVGRTSLCCVAATSVGPSLTCTSMCPCNHKCGKRPVPFHTDSESSVCCCVSKQTGLKGMTMCTRVDQPQRACCNRKRNEADKAPVVHIRYKRRQFEDNESENSDSVKEDNIPPSSSLKEHIQQIIRQSNIIQQEARRLSASSKNDNAKASMESRKKFNRTLKSSRRREVQNENMNSNANGKTTCPDEKRHDQKTKRLETLKEKRDRILDRHQSIDLRHAILEARVSDHKVDPARCTYSEIQCLDEAVTKLVPGEDSHCLKGSFNSPSGKPCCPRKEDNLSTGCSSRPLFAPSADRNKTSNRSGKQHVSIDIVNFEQFKCGSRESEKSNLNVPVFNNSVASTHSVCVTTGSTKKLDTQSTGSDGNVTGPFILVSDSEASSRGIEELPFDLCYPGSVQQNILSTPKSRSETSCVDGEVSTAATALPVGTASSSSISEMPACDKVSVTKYIKNNSVGFEQRIDKDRRVLQAPNPNIMNDINVNIGPPQNQSIRKGDHGQTSKSSPEMNAQVDKSSDGNNPMTIQKVARIIKVAPVVDVNEDTSEPSTVDAPTPDLHLCTLSSHFDRSRQIYKSSSRGVSDASIASTDRSERNSSSIVNLRRCQKDITPHESSSSGSSVNVSSVSGVGEKVDTAIHFGTTDSNKKASIPRVRNVNAANSGLDVPVRTPEEKNPKKSCQIERAPSEAKNGSRFLSELTAWWNSPSCLKDGRCLKEFVEQFEKKNKDPKHSLLREVAEKQSTQFDSQSKENDDIAHHRDRRPQQSVSLKKRARSKGNLSKLRYGAKDDTPVTSKKLLMAAHIHNQPCRHRKRRVPKLHFSTSATSQVSRSSKLVSDSSGDCARLATRTGLLGQYSASACLDVHDLQVVGSSEVNETPDQTNYQLSSSSTDNGFRCNHIPVSSWKTRHVSVGKVVSANDLRLVIEGAHNLDKQGRGPVMFNKKTLDLSTKNCSPRDVLPFRIVLFLYKGKRKGSIKGTYLRSLETSDKNFKWKFCQTEHVK